MVTPQRYTSRFKNRYGEAWDFQYDPVKGNGILCGTDVDWQEYQVLDGRVSDLILNDEEMEWLRTAWREAIDQQTIGTDEFVNRPTD